MVILRAFYALPIPFALERKLYGTKGATPSSEPRIDSQVDMIIPQV
jgi:hypothetical protein